MVAQERWNKFVKGVSVLLLRRIGRNIITQRYEKMLKIVKILLNHCFFFENFVKWLCFLYYYYYNDRRVRVNLIRSLII